ncbi:MAG: glycosyltransferase family 2 protein [Gammaproteobacteria bacterium]|nr:glycosyltransferase family 2 protein [Gammaproteobacteria bacterium]
MTEVRDDQILVSVVMPVYNAASSIDRAVTSVLSQTLTNFELILVDDASNRATAEKLNLWKNKDNRVNLIRLEQNCGVSEARNIGISKAKAKRIALADADDEWMPEKLAVQLNFHRQKKCSFSCTEYFFGGAIVSGRPLIGYQDLLFNNVINTSTVMVDSDQIVLRFSSQKRSEDYLEWLRIVKTNPIFLIKQPLATRSTTEGISSNKLKMAARRWVIYRRKEHLSLLYSIYCFAQYTLSGIKKHWRAKVKNISPI